MSSSVYCLHCTVCKSNYESRSSWLNHLCQEYHQSKVRNEVWWRRDIDKLDNDKGRREECTVVMFSSISLTKSLLESVLLRLNGTGDTDKVNILVTDLVWWPERDRFACFQLESRLMVDQLFQYRLENGANLQLGSELVQMTRAVDILKLEWKALLPPPPPPTTPIIVNKMTKVTPPNIQTPTSTIPPSSLIPQPKTPLQLQFNLICTSIEIPDDQFNYALNVISILQKILSELHPSGKLTMFRNYYLRLWNMASNTLLINAYIADNPADQNRFLLLDKNTETAIFEDPRFKKELPGYSPTRLGGSIDGGNPYLNPTTNFRFHFISFPTTIVETQLCSLIQYFCHFDKRVKPLLTLLHFWATSNHVRISEKNISVPAAIYNCPEPIAFEWLIILFLSHEKVIPTVRQVLHLPHTPLLVHKTDVGFLRDPEYLKTWGDQRGLSSEEDVTSDNFILEVVKLAQRFFQFYSSRLADDEDIWLLNPKDGVIVPRNKKGWIAKSGLSSKEKRCLIYNQGSELSKQWNLVIKPYNIYMLNPLCIMWRLSFCVDTWRDSTREKMREMGQRLQDYLAGGENGDDLGGNLKLILSVVEEGEANKEKRKAADTNNYNKKKSKLV